MTRDTSPSIGATVLGYPRIGRHRELKHALEALWSGTGSAAEVETTARQIRHEGWARMAAAGLDSVPVNTFSLYDHVLDGAVLVGAVPDRFAALEPAGPDVGGVSLRTYTAMARGEAGVAPLEMTKWFDTNYHYLVPEIGPRTRFRLAGDKPIGELSEAMAADVPAPRPVLVGPASLLLLAKPAEGAPAGFAPYHRLDALVDVYAELLAALADAGAGWVQFDEPAFVTDRSDEQVAALRAAYERLGSLTHRPALFVASYFGRLGAALPALAATPVEAVGVDLVAGAAADPLSGADLSGTTLVAGVVDGRNVWRTDLAATLDTLSGLRDRVGRLAVSTSCSLLHVPHDVDDEHDLDPILHRSLAFADQKLAEVATLARGLRDGRDAVRAELDGATAALRERNAAAWWRNDAVRKRIGELRPDDSRRPPYPERVAAQAVRLPLPVLPTTTIGSFPQTSDLRSVRAGWRAGRIDDDTYRSRMRAEIERVVRLQEQLDLDVLVHGEPERNDMVQYFAENLDGFATTTHGWVQSYGTRCVRPPILYGDVTRTRPITVEWSGYAQSLTQRPVKGMLTGPVTILAWSFVRDDQPLADTARQVALALRDEVADLEAAGIAIVQVDEPALRELLPLRADEQSDYLSWAVEVFGLATSGAAPSTQVHTHLCYSEFGEVIDAIDALDADVTSIEAARSRMEVLADLGDAGFARGVGPGVYDIHSPRVPDVDELAPLLRTALHTVPAERLWVNPDCGLKTRGYTEVEPALTNLVAAAKAVRAALATA